MLTYNRPQLIGRAIQSVVDQTFQDWELLVVHDGHNDFTSRAVSDWVARDSRIRYLHRDKGGNIANATNYGIRAAKAPLIAILDDDDYWGVPDKLARQVEFLVSRPDHVGVGGGAIVIDENGRETLRYLKPVSDEDIRRNALFSNPMAHSTCVYRRSAVESIGLYDETLAGFQDWDVCLKLGRLGKLYNFPEYLSYYQIWQGGGSYQQQLANTRCSIAIVKRHRDAYRGYGPAMIMAYSHHAYAHLPLRVKSVTFSFLSRAKKSLFSSRPVQA